MAHLSVAGPRGTGGPSRAPEDVERPVKRLAKGTLERVECFVSNSSPSDERVTSPVEGAKAELVECTAAKVHEAIGTIGVTLLVIDESFGADTLSHVYDGGANVTVDAPPTPWSPIGMHLTSLLSCQGVDPTFVRCAVASDREGKFGDGGSTSVGSEAARSLALASATIGTVDLGPLCRADFKVSKGFVGVCGGGC